MIREIVFEEMDNQKYTANFEAALSHKFQIDLSSDQKEILADTIEQARENGLPPADLAENLGENFAQIFPN